jgi:quinol monooxygenase YgiN
MKNKFILYIMSILFIFIGSILAKEEKVQFFVKFDIKQNKINEFLPKFTKNAIESRLEQGNITFEMYKNNSSKTKFYELIRWKDNESINIHFTKEYFKDLTSFREVYSTTSAVILDMIELKYVMKDLLFMNKEYKNIFLLLNATNLSNIQSDFNSLASNLILNDSIVEFSLHQLIQNKMQFFVNIKLKKETKEDEVKTLLDNKFFIKYKPTEVIFANSIVK